MFPSIKRPISGGWPSQVTKASLRLMSASMPVIPGAALPSSILSRTSRGSSGNIRGDLRLVAPTRSLCAPLTWRAMSRTPDRNHLPQMVPLDTMASIYPLYSKTTNFLFQKHNKKCPFFILLWIVLVKAPQNEKEMGEALVGEQKAKLVMDVQVVESLQAKDTQAFRSLIERLQQPMTAYLHRLVGDREVALDLAQDTFLQVYKEIGKTSQDLFLDAWIYRIATNYGLRYLNRKLLKQFVNESIVAWRNSVPFMEHLLRRASGNCG